jgi:hypothetical protein
VAGSHGGDTDSGHRRAREAARWLCDAKESTESDGCGPPAAQGAGGATTGSGGELLPLRLSKKGEKEAGAGEQKGEWIGERGVLGQVIEARAAGPGGRVPVAYGHVAHGSCRDQPGNGGGARPGTKRGKVVGRPSGSGVGASARVQAERVGPGHVEREQERRRPRLALLAGQKGGDILINKINCFFFQKPKQ